MNTRTDNPLHVSDICVLGDKFAICDQEGKTQGIACVWNGDEIPTPDEMAGYAQNAHVLYRTYSSSFQDL